MHFKGPVIYVSCQAATQIEVYFHHNKSDLHIDPTAVISS